MASLMDFVVIDSLRVHDLIVEPKRVKATYTVTKLESSESFDLIYSYQDKYFDPKSIESKNLASMMVVQVALNYGLFCHKIILDGLFDETDKTFVREMIENTSREILTNKLLIDNEFIKQEFKNLKFEKQATYTAAEILFKSETIDVAPYNQTEKTLDDHYAILSSGGKDSLLTYGIVRELGVPHPVFINESGRHWFTAVNAYRTFAEHEPNTVKPWCNSDRLFNWMLRHFSFIKENYQSIRADIYPIRLWTVSVFLFGVLPVVRKRRIGNILIGNEFDTTEISVSEGIEHYNGLYDQSRIFDNYLSDYYSKKGWQIKQYSILRTLSEMLIMKVLVKRYPDLQKDQVSCHAAHENDGRMLPCGKCEKCRRIIGMLTALDEDASRCGYTLDQITYGLLQLSQKNVKQLESDAAHLYHILVEKGALSKNDFTKDMANAHPEIMNLRFHPQRSQVDDIPKHLRKDLFELLATYTDGIIAFEENNWVKISLNKII